MSMHMSIHMSIHKSALYTCLRPLTGMHMFTPDREDKPHLRDAHPQVVHTRKGELCSLCGPRRTRAKGVVAHLECGAPRIARKIAWEWALKAVELASHRSDDHVQA